MPDRHKRCLMGLSATRISTQTFAVTQRAKVSLPKGSKKSTISMLLVFCSWRLAYGLSLALESYSETEPKSQITSGGRWLGMHVKGWDTLWDRNIGTQFYSAWRGGTLSIKGDDENQTKLIAAFKEMVLDVCDEGRKLL